MSREGLDALRARVSDDPELARRLHGLEPERFVGEVARLAAQMGFEVAEADVDAAIVQARSAWMLRWVR